MAKKRLIIEDVEMIYNVIGKCPYCDAANDLNYSDVDEVFDEGCVECKRNFIIDVTFYNQQILNAWKKKLK